MIRFKDSVRVHPDTLKNPAMWRILTVADTTCPPGYDPTVTSGCDGKHKQGSKHYSGRAWDFRTRDYPAGESPQTWARVMQRELGQDFYVLLKGDHIHVQSNA